MVQPKKKKKTRVGLFDDRNVKQVGQGPQSMLSTAYFVGILEIKYLPKEEGNLGKNSLLIFFILT